MPPRFRVSLGQRFRKPGLGLTLDLVDRRLHRSLAGRVGGGHQVALGAGDEDEDAVGGEIKGPTVGCLSIPHQHLFLHFYCLLMILMPVDNVVVVIDALL